MNNLVSIYIYICRHIYIYTNKNVIFKLYINDTFKNHFKLSLTTVNWEEISNIVSANKAYDELLKKNS